MKKAFIALAPPLFCMWLVIGVIKGFVDATILMAVALAIAALVGGWIYLVVNYFDV